MQQQSRLGRRKITYLPKEINLINENFIDPRNPRKQHATRDPQTREFFKNQTRHIPATREKNGKPALENNPICHEYRFKSWHMTLITNSSPSVVYITQQISIIYDKNFYRLQLI